MSKCDEIQELIHGYLDKELLQFQTQQVENHIEACEACLKILNEYKKLKSEVKAMKLQQPTQKEWDQARPPVTVRATRGIGWTLFLVGMITVTVFGAYEFMVDPVITAIEKIMVLTVTLGLSFLFVSVAYERFRAYKTDKYKEIEK